MADAATDNDALWPVKVREACEALSQKASLFGKKIEASHVALARALDCIATLDLTPFDLTQMA